LQENAEEIPENANAKSIISDNKKCGTIGPIVVKISYAAR